MSLKDNFNQAVKEILRKDGLVGEDLSKESKKKSELDRYLDTQGKNVIPESKSPDAESEISPSDEQDSSEKPSAQAQPSSTETGSNNSTAFSQLAQIARQSGGVRYDTSRGESDRAHGSSATDSFSSGVSSGGGSGIPPRSPRTAVPGYGGRQPESPYYETEETTVISRNTVVDGSIRSFANVNVDGNVKGDVKITKNISVTGKIVGDVECNNSIMTGASMQGNLASKGQVQIDRDSLVLGDIAAQYLDLNGKVKGNIDVSGKAEFKTDSIIIGNITASTITVLDGATIQGYVNTTFLQESTTTIFPDAISVSE